MTIATEILNAITGLNIYWARRKCREACEEMHVLAGSKREVYDFPDGSRLNYWFNIDRFEVQS